MLPVVNWEAVVVAALLQMALGAVWYRVFASPWTTLIGLKTEDMATPGPASGPRYALALLASVVLAAAMGMLATLAHAVTPISGFKLGLLVGLGFVVPAMWPNFVLGGRPFKLFAINVGYPLLSAVMQGLLFGSWR